MMDRTNLAVINENMQIGVSFYADHKDAYDPDANIIIQTSIFTENGMQKEECSQLQLVESPITWLYEDTSNEDYPWRMGVYHIEIHYKCEKYVSGVFVQPLHLSIDQVLLMHDYLEKQIDEVIYDFNYSNRTSSAPLNENMTRYWYYDYTRFIKVIHEEFMYMMTVISKSPIEAVRG
ncbi:hypothetical protein H5P36_22000 [Bacillus sp. APMAM]|nr:hypothetical protein [Bacillus sp. APMAM]RTZ53736.1 hypothetical protein EKO25_21860 [Bacillus sp. SAJ1]